MPDKQVKVIVKTRSKTLCDVMCEWYHAYECMLFDAPIFDRLRCAKCRENEVTK
jgi:hypothetical protein